MKFKQFFYLVLCLFFIFAGLSTVSASGEKESSADGAKPVTIKIATGKGEADVKTIAANNMKKELESRSNGLVKVEVYPAGQLLTDTGMLDGIPNGTADIGVCGLGWWSGKVPEVSILGAMGIFDSADHYWRTCESGMFDYLEQKFDENADTKVLAWVYSGMSDCILTRKDAVHVPGDMTGLKIRVPNNSMGSAVKALGASPVVIPYADIYTALQTGVVDGTWGTLGSTYNNNFFDLVDYVSELPLAYSDAFGIIVANATWNKWPKEIQDLVAQASKEQYEFSRNYIADENETMWKDLKSRNDLSVYFVPDNDVPKFAALVGPGQLSMLKGTVTEQSYKTIIDLIEKYR